MRRKLATHLKQGDLLIDADSKPVQKITALIRTEGGLAVELENQITEERSRRDLAGDESVDTEEPYSIEVGSGTVTVELAQVVNDEDRPLYRLYVHEGDELLHESTDLALFVGSRPNNSRAARAALDVLLTAAYQPRGDLSERAEGFAAENMHDLALASLTEGLRL